jgi:hypothetical protein
VNFDPGESWCCWGIMEHVKEKIPRTTDPGTSAQKPCLRTEVDPELDREKGEGRPRNGD